MAKPLLIGLDGLEDGQSFNQTKYRMKNIYCKILNSTLDVNLTKSRATNLLEVLNYGEKVLFGQIAVDYKKQFANDVKNGINESCRREWGRRKLTNEIETLSDSFAMQNRFSDLQIKANGRYENLFDFIGELVGLEKEVKVKDDEVIFTPVKDTDWQSKKNIKLFEKTFQRHNKIHTVVLFDDRLKYDIIGILNENLEAFGYSPDITLYRDETLYITNYYKVKNNNDVEKIKQKIQEHLLGYDGKISIDFIYSNAGEYLIKEVISIDNISRRVLDELIKVLSKGEYNSLQDYRNKKNEAEKQANKKLEETKQKKQTREELKQETLKLRREERKERELKSGKYYIPSEKPNEFGINYDLFATDNLTEKADIKVNIEDLKNKVNKEIINECANTYKIYRTLKRNKEKSFFNDFEIKIRSIFDKYNLEVEDYYEDNVLNINSLLYDITKLVKGETYFGNIDKLKEDILYVLENYYNNLYRIKTSTLSDSFAMQNRFSNLQLKAGNKFDSVFEFIGNLVGVKKYTRAELTKELLRKKQEKKYYKDTEYVEYTKKYKINYDFISSEDLINLEKNPAIAYEQIVKEKVWTPYDVQKLKDDRNTSGAAFYKVKLREYVQKRPANNKISRLLYVKGIEFLRNWLEDKKNLDDIVAYNTDYKRVPLFKKQLEELLENELTNEVVRIANISPNKTNINEEIPGSFRDYNTNAIFGKQFDYIINNADYGNEYVLRFYQNLRKADEKNLDWEENWDWADKYLDKTKKVTKKETTEDEGADKIEVSEKRLPLQHIVRKGGLKVTDDMITTEFIQKEFLYKNVIFGNYVNDRFSKQFVKYFIASMLDLGEILDLNISAINKSAGLSISFGSMGGGSKAVASYFPNHKTINLTKSKGDGSIAHEWAHYLDNILEDGDLITGTPKFATDSYKIKEVRNFLSNVYFSHKEIRENYKLLFFPGYISKNYTARSFARQFFLNCKNLDEAIEKFKSYFRRYPGYGEFTIGDKKQTNYNKKNLDFYLAAGAYISKEFNNSKMVCIEADSYCSYMFRDAFYADLSKSKKYWTTPKEMFARAFECMVLQKLKKAGRENNYLIRVNKEGKDYSPDKDVFPWLVEKEDIEAIEPAFDELINMLREKFGSFQTSLTERENETTTLSDSFAKNVSNRYYQLKDIAVTKFKNVMDFAGKLIGFSQKNILKGKDCKIITSSKKIGGYYAIYEIDFLIPSNDPFTFAPNKNYPKECQTRSYSEDKSEQEKVALYSSEFLPGHLLNNSLDATTGPPIILPEGVVLGGNGRSMVINRVAEQNKDAYSEYVNELKETAVIYGFKKKDIARFKKPVLVRVIEAPINECVTYSNILNSNTTQNYDEVREGIAVALQLEQKPHILNQLAQALEESEAESLSEMLDDKKIAAEIINILTREGILNNTNMSKLINLQANTFTQLGVVFVKVLLIGSILPDKKLIENAENYVNKIIKALPSVLRLRTLPAEWNLIPQIREVVKLETKRRARGIKSIQAYIMQDDAFESKPEPLTIELWRILNDVGINDFKNLLRFYVERAKEQGESSIFAEPSEPIVVLANWKEFNEKQKNKQAEERRLKQEWAEKHGN